ncbi:UDP-N-acetylmuramate dehydrogenase [Niveibacterium terrae]|uniref:UDP-N-acetylmuramate dehydrogenase n=1 Tax=Niveibacterium terrae TaxID=3373598 RepID=UPI003A944183
MSIPAPIRADADLSTLNTLGVPARAAWFAEPTNLDALADSLAWADRASLPVLLLGGGSNIVFAADWPGLVLRPALAGRELIGTDKDFFHVRVAAGENWHETVRWTLEQGWPGLENLALIPGVVGAGPIQNIGAYGLELADRIEAVEVFDRDSGEVRSLTHSECRFAYRDSVFKHEGRGLVVLSVTLALPRAWQPNARYRDLAEALDQKGITDPSALDIFAAVVEVRQRKLPDPARTGNVGSFFKNPIVDEPAYAALKANEPDLVAYPQPDGRFKLAAGWLIDRAGWKGRKMGAAGVHANQALVLVNLGGARGAEILALARSIQADIETRYGITLETEPILIE